MTTEQLQNLIETLQRNKTTAQRQAEHETNAEWRGFYRGQVFAYSEALALLELAAGPGRPATPNSPTAEDLAELVSADEAAAYLGLTTRTVWRHIGAGLLPAVRIGKRTVRIRKADLLTYAKPAR